MKCPKRSADNTDTARFCSNCVSQLTRSGQLSAALTKTLESPVRALSKGSLVAGKFRIIDEIGNGGMGVVYKAEDITPARRFAVRGFPEAFVENQRKDGPVREGSQRYRAPWEIIEDNQ
jgi:serine/threonine protein kinase